MAEYSSLHEHVQGSSNISTRDNLTNIVHCFRVSSDATVLQVFVGFCFLAPLICPELLVPQDHDARHCARPGFTCDSGLAIPKYLLLHQLQPIQRNVISTSATTHDICHLPKHNT